MPCYHHNQKRGEDSRRGGRQRGGVDTRGIALATAGTLVGGLALGALIFGLSAFKESRRVVEEQFLQVEQEQKQRERTKEEIHDKRETEQEPNAKVIETPIAQDTPGVVETKKSGNESAKFEDECPICLEEYRNDLPRVVLLPCNHTCCVHCSAQVVSKCMMCCNAIESRAMEQISLA